MTNWPIMILLRSVLEYLCPVQSPTCRNWRTQTTISHFDGSRVVGKTSRYRRSESEFRLLLLSSATRFRPHHRFCLHCVRFRTIRDIDGWKYGRRESTNPPHSYYYSHDAAAFNVTGSLAIRRRSPRRKKISRENSQKKTSLQRKAASWQSDHPYICR